MMTAKAISVLTLSLTAALPAFGRDNIGWAGNRLWRAPVVTSVAFLVSGGGEELNEACDAFEELASKAEGLPAKTRKRLFEEERKVPLKGLFPSRDFSIELKTDLRFGGEVLEPSVRNRLTRIAEAQAQSEKRLYYTQSVDSQRVDVSTLEVVDIDSEEGSLTALAKALGVPQLPVQFVETGSGVKLVVSGKDLACDLVRGRAKLRAAGNSYAFLHIDKQAQLKVFYHKLSEISNGVLENFKRPTQRAALLGYRLSEYFASLPNMTEERAESVMLNALDTYFTPDSLDHNSLWKKSSGTEKALSFSGMSELFRIEVVFASSVGQ